MEIFRIQHSSDPRGQGKRRADFGHLSDLSPKRKELVNLVNTENIVLLFKPQLNFSVIPVETGIQSF